ncbi:hypothetical protein AC244_16210 [Ensifer adhaerens]|uniref:Transmembrane protein n=1 Tax=Ensifer adhaerens TaxID=106592 RepID=A0A0L8BT68_ENSAD|nr:hypothetical protein [Ensifer adhaerens]KOF17902.1 hypothetical protein AC244_16210 [Ensifer adhaerens]
MLNALATEIDRLVDNQRAAVTETPSQVIVYQLEGEDAIRLCDLLAGAGLAVETLEDAGGEFSIKQLSADLRDVKIVASKPISPDGVEAVLTKTAFKQLLMRPPTAPIIWLQGLPSSFETRTTRYSDWDDTTEFHPEDETIDPRRFVRVLGDFNVLRSGLGRWLLREPSAIVPANWGDVAAVHLTASLAQEVETDGELLFRGPPATRFAAKFEQALDAKSFEELQRAAQWVYENDREVENRHALLAAEVARSALRGGNARDLVGILHQALEGAKIAYNFGVSRQSQETLKALSDLRKSVSDETVKLADTARGLAAAVTGAAVGNIGILIARATLPASSSFIQILSVLLALVLAIYVFVVIGSGLQFLRIQKGMRNEWKPRLYRYLNDDEYSKMVETPATRAERGFYVTAVGGASMALLMFAAVFYVAICGLNTPGSTLSQSTDIVGSSAQAPSTAKGKTSEIESQVPTSVPTNGLPPVPQGGTGSATQADEMAPTSNH